MVEVRETNEFRAWRTGLKDKVTRKRIAARIDRLEYGLLGDAKPIGDGISELRLDFGPGYRLYFVQRGQTIIILLCGGDKSSQQRDIAKAKDLAKELE